MEMKLFSVVPLEATADKRLTLEQLKVLIALFSFRTKETDVVWPSRAALSERTGIHVENITKATTALAELGWLEKTGNRGKSRSSQYELMIPSIVAQQATGKAAKKAVNKQAQGAGSIQAEWAGSIQAEWAGSNINTNEHTNEVTNEVTSAHTTNPHTDFSEAIETKPEKPLTAFPLTAFPYPEFPYPENPHLVINNNKQVNTVSKDGSRAIVPIDADADAHAHETATTPTATNGKTTPPKKPKQTTQADALALLASYGVTDSELCADYLAIRKVKRAPVTETVLRGLQREADKAGISVSDAIRYAIESGWQGFKADWYQRQNPAQAVVSASGNVTPINSKQGFQNDRQRQRQEFADFFKQCREASNLFQLNATTGA
jgi:hypothetical protein